MKSDNDEYIYNGTKTNTQMVEIMALRRANRGLVARNQNLETALRKVLIEVERSGDRDLIADIVGDVEEILKGK